MFTGIVEELGRVTRIQHLADSAVLTIHGPGVLADAVPGASLAVNGVCLTVVEHDASTFAVDVMAETLSRSSLGELEVGSAVNLERAMRADGRFGGHLVQGHVDRTGTLADRRRGERWDVLRFVAPSPVTRYLVEKGSITVDGVSLTISALSDDGFEVSLIPTTLRATTLGRTPIGGTVNLEIDLLAKYVERLVQR